MASNSSVLLLMMMMMMMIPLCLACNSSVLDILPQYGLPKGLLPDCVKDYRFSPEDEDEDGRFIVDLENTCYIHFDDNLVYYEKRITGTLKMGSITYLNGIQVKRFLVWFHVHQIQVDLPPNHSIYFQLGFLNKKLSVHQFNTPHSCHSQSTLSWNHIFQLPPPVDEEISMLLTE